MAELDMVLTRLDALDKRMTDGLGAINARLGDQWQAVNGRLDDLGQRITAVETRLTSAEHRMASSWTVNLWGDDQRVDCDGRRRDQTVDMR